MTYQKLYYNSVTWDGVSKSFGPNLTCPKCKTKLTEMFTTLTATQVIKDSKLRTWICHKCKSKIELYVAVARTEEGKEQIQISVNPIDKDFLEKEEAERILVK